MAGSHRKGSSMMAMLDAKPLAKPISGLDVQNGQNGQIGQYWTDVGDHLSPLRKHLITNYLQVSDEEAMPLVGEYFGVALSFVALGALVRASNSSKRKHKKMVSEEEKLDIRSCSRFERMALESMLKESMERLGKLSKNAYELEVRVRNLVDENKNIMVARDMEKVHLLKRFSDAEKVAQELRALRKAEGRANERVMSIVAAKEQDWLKEKRNLQKEIEKLKETVTGMNREAKMQARRCRNPTCEHCKGIDRVVRNVKGRMSLRELYGLGESSQASLKREVVPDVLEQTEPSKSERQEIEEDRVLIKAIELKKKQRDYQNKIEKAGENSNCAGPSTSKELLIKQDMESELASILKRVGMLKQKSYVTPPVPRPNGEGLATEEMLFSVDDSEAHDEINADRNLWEEGTDEASVLPEPNMHDPTLEIADCASDKEDSDINIELENALKSADSEGKFSPGERVGSTLAESENLTRDSSSNDARSSSSTDEQQQVVEVDDALVAHQESSSTGEELPLPAPGHEGTEDLEEEHASVTAESATADPADIVREEEHTDSALCIKEADGQEHLTQEATVPDLDSNRPETESINEAESEPSSSSETTHDDEQVLGVVEDDDAAEFCDALSSPLDSDTAAESEEGEPSAVLVSEEPEQKQNHSEYGNGMNVNENWGYEDTHSCTEQGVLENQDIPVFERKNSDDDFAGELPEPEEKRVCGLETLDSNGTSSMKEMSGTAAETSEQEEGLKVRVNAIAEELDSQKDNELVGDETGSVTDVKPKSDTVIADSPDLELAEITA